MCYFGRNAGCFALQIVAIADWGQKFMDVGIQLPYTHVSSVLVHPPTGVTPGQSSSPCQAISGERTRRGHVR